MNRWKWFVRCTMTVSFLALCVAQASELKVINADEARQQISSLRGHVVVVFFWDPHDGRERRMLKELPDRLHPEIRFVTMAYKESLNARGPVQGGVAALVAGVRGSHFILDADKTTDLYTQKLPAYHREEKRYPGHCTDTQFSCLVLHSRTGSVVQFLQRFNLFSDFNDKAIRALEAPRQEVRTWKGRLAQGGNLYAFVGADNTVLWLDLFALPEVDKKLNYRSRTYYCEYVDLRTNAVTFLSDEPARPCFVTATGTIEENEMQLTGMSGGVLQ